MTDPVTVHVWMPDGRSLCDRRAPRRLRPDSTREEIDAAHAEVEAAPMCGSCLLLVSRIRRIAAADFKLHPGVWPAKPSQAWANLRDTRWALTFDLDAHAERAAHVDKHSTFDAFMKEVDPVSVDELIAEWEEQKKARKKTRKKAKKRQES